MEHFQARNLIKTWLKNGYWEFTETPIDSPYRAILFPLLTNIALHGIENVLGIKTISTTGHNFANNTFAFIRYADDFIIFWGF